MEYLTDLFLEQLWRVLYARDIMLQCIEGLKHLFPSLSRYCNLDTNKQSRGLEDPELLSRETVCMLSTLLYVCFISCPFFLSKSYYKLQMNFDLSIYVL